MWFMSKKYQIQFVIVLTVTYDIARCDPISNTNFNSHLRDYAAVDVNNITNVKTLQKEDSGKYATFTPASNPIKFKEIPDSALSSSSNGRGLLYHEQPGYAVNDYDDGPHYSHGHDYHLYNPHQDAHGPPVFEHNHHNSYPHHDYHDPHGHLSTHDHGHHYSGYGHGGHDGHDGHHHGGHGPYHNKHYKHALAAKTVLWPIAGVALLTAAAALVSNPVLLQLGVVSGKRRRRDTEEVTGPDFPSDTIAKYENKMRDESDEDEIVLIKDNSKMKTKQNRILKIASLTETAKKRELADNQKERNIDRMTTSRVNYNSNNDDDRFIPIPIKLRTPKHLTEKNYQ